ncbi:uncharacterized protein LOC121767604 [Salvia splendens]|uniref:uncharacterized protein LOC121767604 n=1 Tax=Salvia splendens TaxID=180675 RepID=UPI001C2805D9|nr:uncharacterized protein LOC121767604 [Salvia splendens]
MPYSVYEKLGEPELVKTKMTLQLANGSCIHPKGILKDEIVKLNKFVYPANFFVMEKTEPAAGESVGILLGRPFLSTTSAVIDVRNGTLHLNFKGERLTFGVDKNGKQPQDSKSLHSAIITKPRVQKCLERDLFKETPTDFSANGHLKKEAAEWFDARLTGGPNEEDIEKAIMDFCKPPQPVGSTRIVQLEGDEKPPDQGGPMESKLKGGTTPASQILSPPALPGILRALTTQMLKEPCEPDLQGQKRQLLDELGPSQEAIKRKILESIWIDPSPCVHSPKSGEEATPYSVQQGRLDPTLRREELTVGQKNLLFKRQVSLMTKKQKSEWDDPCPPFSTMNGHERKPYRDRKPKWAWWKKFH